MSSMPRIIDLTLTLRHGMRGVEFEKFHSVNEHGWNSRILHLYSHGGTHMDAPLHFDAGEGTIDRIPLDRSIGPAWVVSLPGIEPRTQIGVRHLGAIAAKVRPGDGLLLRTGWSAYVDQPQYYRDQLPRISLELAE